MFGEYSLLFKINQKFFIIIKIYKNINAMAGELFKEMKQFQIRCTN